MCQQNYDAGLLVYLFYHHLLTSPELLGFYPLPLVLSCSASVLPTPHVLGLLGSLCLMITRLALFLTFLRLLTMT